MQLNTFWELKDRLGNYRVEITVLELESGDWSVDIRWWEWDENGDKQWQAASLSRSRGGPRLFKTLGAAARCVKEELGFSEFRVALT